jgi:hypothetical protein
MSTEIIIFLNVFDMFYALALKLNLFFSFQRLKILRRGHLEQNFRTCLKKYCLMRQYRLNLMFLRGRSSAWLERLPVTQEVEGSSPFGPAELKPTIASGLYSFLRTCLSLFTLFKVNLTAISTLALTMIFRCVFNVIMNAGQDLLKPKDPGGLSILSPSKPNLKLLSVNLN